MGQTHTADHTRFFDRGRAVDFLPRREDQVSVGRRRAWLRSAVAALLASTVAFDRGWSRRSAAVEPDDPVQRAARIKAAYLFQLLGYVDWPDETFPAADSPIKVGVYGESPITSVLSVIAKTKQAKGRRILLIPVQTPEDVASCQLLFVSSDAMAAVKSGDIEISPTAAMLVVGEDREFFAHGAVVNLVLVENKVRLQLSLAAARVRQLRVSSKLSNIATIVE